MNSSSRSAPLFGEGSSTLMLLLYLSLAIVLMVTDYRTDSLGKVRQSASLLLQPFYTMASLPARLAHDLRDAWVAREAVQAERDGARQQLLIARAQLDRLQAVQQENQRLRELLGGTRGLQMSVQLANVVDVDLDPFRHRIQLDVGEESGVREGLALIDASGVVGQVLSVGPRRSTALLISDPSHGVPVQVVRTGLRVVAFGTGETDRLRLPNIPQSADIRVGDALVTSGLGGRFPAGLPVATVASLQPDDTRLFMIASATPTAALDRSGQLLLLWTAEATPEVGPPLHLAEPETQARSTEQVNDPADAAQQGAQ
ncbi:MAG: Cell shape-determining protein MreC [Alphaproteobacteria bacterium ADurb.BinA280]|nr:MAG: Cell shape-determining protein MreC [Alphaproteobacteria bacterium ADurb.BinA280]